MPLIVIHNAGMDPRLMTKNFVAGLKKTVASVSELKIDEEDITVSINAGLADEEDLSLIVIVELLFDKPERTLEVRQYLAKTIAEYIHGGLMAHGGDRKVEVAVKKFNPEKDAFYAE